jgi:hypothetical protein
MMLSRREFAAGALAAGAVGCVSSPYGAAWKADEKKFVWGELFHLSTNMWSDYRKGEYPDELINRSKQNYKTRAWYSDKLLTTDELWYSVTGKMRDAGMNMVVIDLGDGVEWPSHPEIAVEGAWSVEKLRKEIQRVRAMGLEPIPKLNFSTAHDAWLGEYQRMVSTKIYYGVCADLIRDVAEIFDRPRFLHLGYDEETAGHQSWGCYGHIVVRAGSQWWHDFNFLRNEVEKNGMRAWIWSDYIWHHEKEFLDRMSRDVLQSNWYYYNSMVKPTNHPKPEMCRPWIEAFEKLDKAGFDQIPCGSTCECDENFGELVPWCRQRISKDRLKGFLMAPWSSGWPAKGCKTVEQSYHKSIDLVRAAM